MTETKEKKKPKKFPEVAALTRVLRLVADLDVDARTRVLRQALEHAQGEANAFYMEQAKKSPNMFQNQTPRESY
jgi:hypothetical protein